MNEQQLPEPRSVVLPNYNNVPRWLILQGEIDYRLFLLEQMQRENNRRAPIERMIYESTGYDKLVLGEATDLTAELRWLKAEYTKETT